MWEAEYIIDNKISIDLLALIIRADCTLQLKLLKIL